MNSIKESVSANFMDALRLANMLTSRALADLESKIVENKINPEAAVKLKEDVIKLANVTPIERFMVPRVFDKMSSYLIESMRHHKKDLNTKYYNKAGMIKSIVSIGTVKTAAVRFDIGSNYSIISAIPVVVFGARADLDRLASYLIDRSQSALQSCLHLSIKSLYKKTNKYYKKIRPEDWKDKLREKESLSKFITDTGVYRPVEVLIVDELSHGFFPDLKATRQGKLKESLHCLKKCKLNTTYRGICTVAMCSTDDFVGERIPEVMNSFYSISSVLECSSDKAGLHLSNPSKQVVLTIKE